MKPLSAVPNSPHSGHNRHLGLGLLLAVAGSVAFSGKAIIVKLAYRYGVDPVTLIMYRMLFALPLFVGMAWWATYRSAAPVPALTRHDLWGLLALGFSGYYLASFLDFWGLQYISASLERLILYLNPTLVLLLGWGLYGRRITWRQAGAMALSYTGVLVVFGQELRLDGSQTAWGALLVLGSAISYAVYLVYSGEMVKRLGSLRLVGWATSIACLLCLFQFALLRPWSAALVAPEVIALSVLNAVACTAAPVVMVMMGIERLGAGLAAQAGMVGPMSTIVLGVWVLGEPLTPWVVLGTALVVAGVLWVSRQKA